MKIEENISLKPYHTFGVNVKAAGLASFSSLEELQELLEISQSKYGEHLVLGGGSNVLFTDDFAGIILKNNLRGIDVVDSSGTQVLVKAGAGEVWHDLVLTSLKNDLGGLENLSLIPGSVGASPMQNIGAYGQEIKNVFHELEAWHIYDKCLVNFSGNDCEFGYRESVFKNKLKDQFIILNVTFSLDKFPRINTSYGAIEQELAKMGIVTPTIHDVSKAVINIRQSKLPNPAEIGNAGSFFKNPEIPAEHFNTLQTEHAGIVGFPAAGDKIKLAAGWLIEQCGWKGVRKGDAGCHARQALVLVNYGNASGDEIYGLSQQIIESVYKKFGVLLSREVNIVGTKP